MSTRPMDIAWLAGFLEGEGTFQIVETRKTTTGPMYAAQIAATNTSKEVLDRCKEIGGGSVYGPIGRGDVRWKLAYRWSLKGRPVAPLLRELLPMLVTKHEQAQILIALRDETRPGANPSQWGRVPLDTATLARRLDYKMAMHALNHRGALPIPEDRLDALARVRIAIAEQVV